MMLFVQKGNGWIGSLALAFCLVLLMAMPIHAAQGGNQTTQTATDNATAQDKGSAAVTLRQPERSRSRRPREQQPRKKRLTRKK
jgi:hypothetical protein